MKEVYGARIISIQDQKGIIGDFEIFARCRTVRAAHLHGLSIRDIDGIIQLCNKITDEYLDVNLADIMQYDKNSILDIVNDELQMIESMFLLYSCLNSQVKFLLINGYYDEFCRRVLINTDLCRKKAISISEYNIRMGVISYYPYLLKPDGVDLEKTDGLYSAVNRYLDDRCISDEYSIHQVNHIIESEFNICVKISDRLKPSTTTATIADYKLEKVASYYQERLIALKKQGLDNLQFNARIYCWNSFISNEISLVDSKSIVLAANVYYSLDSNLSFDDPFREIERKSFIKWFSDETEIIKAYLTPDFTLVAKYGVLAVVLIAALFFAL